MIDEPRTVGTTDATHNKLKRLVEEEHFAEMLDAYRFAIGYMLARGIDPPEVSTRTIFAVGSLDPDQSLKAAVEALMPSNYDGAIYKMAERLAEAGIIEMHGLMRSGELDLPRLIEDAGELVSE